MVDENLSHGISELSCIERVFAIQVLDFRTNIVRPFSNLPMISSPPDFPICFTFLGGWRDCKQNTLVAVVSVVVVLLVVVLVVVSVLKIKTPSLAAYEAFTQYLMPPNKSNSIKTLNKTPCRGGFLSRLSNSLFAS